MKRYLFSLTSWKDVSKRLLSVDNRHVVTPWQASHGFYEMIEQLTKNCDDEKQTTLFANSVPRIGADSL